MFTMRSILVTGSNRGLGLGLVRHLVKEKNPPAQIIATCRKIAGAQDLQRLAADNENLHVLELDVRDVEQFDEFAKKVGQIVGDNGLNVLFNNAGVSSKFSRIQLVKKDQLTEAFQVNTVAPIMLTKSLLSLLKQAVKRNAEKPVGAEKALVVNMSSILASLTQNTNGGFYPYRCSKVALNMATRSLGADLDKDEIIVTAIHPGWVKTDMGGKNAPLDVDASVSGILRLLKVIDKSHNGGFYQYDGKQLEW